MKKTFEKFASLGIEIQVTELDVSITKLGDNLIKFSTKKNEINKFKTVS